LAERTWNSRSELSESLRVLTSDFHKKTLGRQTFQLSLLSKQMALRKRDHWQPNTHLNKAQSHSNKQTELEGISGDFKGRSTFCDAKRDYTRAMDFPSED